MGPVIKNNKGTREKRGKGEPGGYLHRSIIEKDTVTGWKRIVTKGTSNKDSHKVLPQVFQESDSNKETGTELGLFLNLRCDS